MIEELHACSALCPALQPDLRSLALGYGYVADDSEYNSRLREVALELVRRQLLDLTTAEQDLLQAVEALDDLSQAVNLLDERLYEWSRLHRQEIVHGKDLAEGLCEDENMGILARAIQGLRESRKTMEMEVVTSAEELAPNLSTLAGPVLAARLISKVRGPAPSGRYALQQSPGNGSGEVPLQASERQCTFAQARHHLPPSCRYRIPQKAQGKGLSRAGRKAGNSRPAGLLWSRTVYGSEVLPGGSPGRYQTQRTE